MTIRGEDLDEDATDLFENAPCGYLSTRVDGTIVRVNRTFESWTGFERRELVGLRRFQDLLAPGSRIYYETHYSPLLHMQESVQEIAVDILRADGSRLAALANSTLRRDAAGRPSGIRTAVLAATDRRRYEKELLEERRREQEIAAQLQRSMLSGALPTFPGLELDVAYRPAVSGTEVGGDWYDAFWLTDHTIALVVGDVVGRGIDAAAAMGQLRSAVRALASTGLGPARLLEALDGYSRRHRVGEAATLLYAQLDVGTGRVCFSCAGHLPPVVVDQDEGAHLVWDGRSFPVAAGANEQRAEAALRLGPGSGLVLYTDGLVERRGELIDEGLDRVLAEIAGHRDDSPLAVALVSALCDPGLDDDVCVLAVKLPAATSG